jgi:hypothetical protein
MPIGAKITITSTYLLVFLLLKWYNSINMEYPHHPGRLEVLRRGRVLQSEAQTLLQPLNNDLSPYDSHEAVVMYSIDQDEYNPITRRSSGTAATLATVETSANIDKSRHQKRREIVDEHVIALGNTAFGLCMDELLTSGKRIGSWSEASHVEPSRLMTWSPHPIMDGEKPINSIQLAFDVTQKDGMPDQSTLERIYAAHLPVIQDIAHGFHTFEQQYGLLQNSLELKRPVAPNSSVIRWDLVGSTPLATGPLSPILFNLLDTFKSKIADIANTNLRGIVDGGDGQNIIIGMPADIDVWDPASIARHDRNNIQPMVQMISDAYNKLLPDFPELNDPELRIAFTNGYVDPDQNSYINAPTLWRIAEKLKQK